MKHIYSILPLALVVTAVAFYKVYSVADGSSSGLYSALAIVSMLSFLRHIQSR